MTNYKDEPNPSEERTFNFRKYRMVTTLKMLNK